MLVIPEPTTELQRRTDARSAMPSGLLVELIERAPVPVVVSRHSDSLMYLNASARSLWPSADADSSKLSVLVDGRPQSLLSLFNSGDTEVERTPMPVVRVWSGDEYGVDSFAWRDPEDSTEWRAAVLRRLSADSAPDGFLGTKANRLKAIVHEFRNSLTAAREALGLVQEGALGPLGVGQRRFIDSAMEDLDHLTRAMSDLTSLWATSASVLRIISRPVDIRRLMEQSTLYAKPIAERKGISLVVETDGRLPVLLGDHDLLVQAVRNVLTNALQHTPPGGEISVRAYLSGAASMPFTDVATGSTAERAEHSDRGESVVIEVQDSGSGISPDDRDRVFRPFERGQVSTACEGAPGGGGMGLGLTIAREIAWTHGGALHVRGGLEKGACFVFRFPLSQGDARSWMLRITRRAIEDVRSLRVSLASILLNFETDADESEEHLLSSAQQLAIKNLRPTDTVLAIDGRLLLLMRGGTRTAAHAVIDRVLRSLTEMLHERGQAFDRRSMPFGVAAYPEDGDSAEAVLQHADDELQAYVSATDSSNGRET